MFYKDERLALFIDELQRLHDGHEACERIH